MLLTKSRIYELNLFQPESLSKLTPEDRLKIASYQGYRKLIKFYGLTIKNADWDTCLCLAMFRGDQEIAEYSASKEISNWDIVLYHAVWAQKQNLIDFCLTKGADTNLSLLCGTDVRSISEFFKILSS